MHTLLEMSVGGAVLILAIVVIRALTINRLPKAAFLLLWAAALCRLVLPLRIPSPISVYAAAGALGAAQPRNGLLLSGAAAQAAEGSVPAMAVISPAAVVWLTGAALLAGVILWLHLRGRRVYGESLPVEHPAVKAWMERHRLRRPVQVRYSDQVDAPLTYGILWPVILLPKRLDWADERLLCYILAHEMAHIRRFDALIKWLLAAVLCLHWFNPLVWVMYVLANRDLELTCDAAVLRQFGPQARTSYATALIDMEEQRSRFSPLASSFSRSALKERITAIMRSKPASVLSAAAAMLLVGVVIGVFATSAPAGAPQLDPIPPATASGTIAVKDAPGRQETLVLPHTEAELDRLLEALSFSSHADMSIAEFNRGVYAALSGEWSSLLYEDALASISEDDPAAAFLYNTVQASLEEYTARMEEAYSGRQNDPAFYGYAEHVTQADVYGDKLTLGTLGVQYSFTYRILDQDGLTVRERDAFLQAVMQAAQDFVDSAAGPEAAEQAFVSAMEAAGAGVSNDKICFTGCQLQYLEAYPDY